MSIRKRTPSRGHQVATSRDRLLGTPRRLVVAGDLRVDLGAVHSGEVDRDADVPGMQLELLGELGNPPLRGALGVPQRCRGSSRPFVERLIRISGSTVQRVRSAAQR
jgi:hypothetical protein